MTTESEVAGIVSEVRHIAKFRSTHLAATRRLLADLDDIRGRTTRRILDPFAGVGTIHQLRPEYETWGVEIEPEWAGESPYNLVGDSRRLASLLAEHDLGDFDAVVTSPTFANRMADSHNARDGSRRNTYTHALGRTLTPGNTGNMQWGADYREVHEQVYGQITDLATIHTVILNMKDHIRAGEIVPVTRWHLEAFGSLGWSLTFDHRMAAPSLRYGQNNEVRVEYEHMLVLERV